MFGDINKVMLMGNVTRDPELRFTPGGAAVLNLSLATNRRYKQGEEWKDEVAYHNLVIWRNSESLAKRIKKGTRIYAEGRLVSRSWDDKDGKKQYKTEVNVDSVILISRFEGDKSDSSGGGADMVNDSEAPAGQAGGELIEPDDLPF